jgi:hypothetical protein
MTRGSGGWRYGAWRCIGRRGLEGCAGAVILVSACGGQAFVLAGGSGDGSTGPEGDSGVAEASPVPTTTALACSTPCSVSSICCTATSETAGHCTGGGGICAPCETVLRCTSDPNCPGAHCCVGPVADMACSGNAYFMGQCKPACLGTETRLCDPSGAASCPVGRSTCSTSDSDLHAWGLPTGQGYGVCTM